MATSRTDKPAAVTHASKPTATVTIEPVGPTRAPDREHSIHVLLSLSASDARHSDRAHVANIVRSALTAFAPANPQVVREVSAARRSSKVGAATTAVVGVEGTSSSRGRPAPEAVNGLRDALLGDGYRVTVRVKRECAEPGCTVFATMDWDRLDEVPPRWHLKDVCGGHNYKTCAGCKSTYVMASMNAAGQAPSVHCEVCGGVLIEWGSSKIWTATRVKKE